MDTPAIDPASIGFRRLQTPDLPLMHRWSNLPQVVRMVQVPGESEPEYLMRVTRETVERG